MSDNERRKTYCKICRLDDEDSGYYIRQNQRAGHTILVGYDQFFMKEGVRRSRVVIIDEMPKRDFDDYYYYVEICSNEPYRAPDAVFQRIEDGVYRIERTQEASDERRKRRSW